MIVLLFVIHVAVAVTLVGVILLQKSEGGALGSIGGGGGMSGFMTGRSTANLLTRTTAILAIAFFTTSVLLVVLSQHTGQQRSLLDRGTPASTQETPSVPAAPAAPPAPATPAAPATPPGPSAPLEK
jgi:preprotein translocase subunit SecG